MKKQNVRTLTLIVSTFRFVENLFPISYNHPRFSFSYLLVGAAIFDALESNREDQLRKQYQLTEASMLRTYNISPNDYMELEEIVVKYQPHKAGAQWKFPGAFYFSLTVITTIGKNKRYMSLSFVLKNKLIEEYLAAHCVPIKAAHDSLLCCHFFFGLIKIFFYIFMCYRCVDNLPVGKEVSRTPTVQL